MSYNITTEFPKEYRASKLLSDGVTDNPFWPLILEASVNGYKMSTNGTATIDMKGINDLDRFDLTTALSVLTVGGEVDGYPCIVELDTDPAATDHPTALDEDSNPITWTDWLGPNQPPNEISGKWYFEPQPNGIRQPLSSIKALIDEGITVIEVEVYKALLPTG